MKRIADIVFAFFLLIISANGQVPTSKDKNSRNNSSVYFNFGWHRIFYTNSTIHFRNDQSANYDFKLIKAKAIDDNDLQIGKHVDAPQFTVKLGWFFKKNPNNGIEISFDHAKYILKQWQQVRLQGTIDDIYYDKDTLLAPYFIKYEHTDGANYYMLNFVKRKQLLQSKNGKHELDLLIKPGAGIVRPRTESTIMEEHANKRYHISGYVAGIESGLRAVVFKNILAEITCKGAYANYFDVLLAGSGKASQQWWSFQYLFLIGYQFGKQNKTKDSWQGY